MRKQNKVQVQVHKKLYHEEYPIEKLDYFSLQTHIVHFLFFLFTFHYYKTVNVRMNKVVVVVVIIIIIIIIIISSSSSSSSAPTLRQVRFLISIPFVCCAMRNGNLSHCSHSLPRLRKLRAFFTMTHKAV